MIAQRRIVLLFVFLGLLGTASVIAQTKIDAFGVGKKQDFLQTSSLAPVNRTILGDPSGPFYFSAELEGSNLHLLYPSPKLTTPNSTQLNLAGGSAAVGLIANYSTKSELDAVFPNGRTRAWRFVQLVSTKVF